MGSFFVFIPERVRAKFLNQVELFQEFQQADNAITKKIRGQRLGTRYIEAHH
jgi:hypothetical protein